MNNVNIWHETTILYINGVPCAVRNATLLARGFQENVVRVYKASVDDESRAILTKLFDLVYTTTILTKKPYYTTEPMWDRTTSEWKKYVTCETNKLFEKDIESVRVKLEYAVSGDEVSMKKLFDYPTELVVDYLKECGMTSCPLQME